MADPRNALLARMQDLMTNYFVDECPANLAWEDFDAEMDALRTCVTDLADDHSHRPPAKSVLTTYLVDVDFLSGNERFATETYAIDASTPERARDHAMAMSLDSNYNDPRVPDLGRTAVARSTDQPTAA